MFSLFKKAEFTIYHLLFILLYNLSIIYDFLVWSWAYFSRISQGWLLSVSALTAPEPTVIHCWISKCVCFCVRVERAVMSVAYRFTLSLLMSFWLPPSGVSALPRHIYQRTDKYPHVLPAISAPHPLSVSQSELSPAITHPLFLAFCPASFPTISAEILIPLLLRSELSLQPRWVAHDSHTQLQTQNCTEIKAKGLQTNIIKFELSSDDRPVAPLILSSLVRCPAGLPGAGTSTIGYSWFLMGPSCELASATSVWMRSQTWMRSSLSANKYRVTPAQFPLWTSKPVFFCVLLSV